MTNYYFDVDGVLADFHSVYDSKNRKYCTSYTFIRNLKPFIENIKLVKELAKKNRVYITTLVATEEGKKARIEWIHEYLPEIPDYRIIVIVGSGKKADHMKTKDGVLIDDNKKNCRAWEKAGHKAILVETKGGKIIF